LLGEDRHDLHAARFVVLRPLCQFTEPASAVGSPRSAVKDEQHRTTLEKTCERAALTFLRWQLERGCGSRHSEMC
jgi:hypothetical protein